MKLLACSIAVLYLVGQSSAEADPPETELIVTVPAYTVWCNNVSSPKDEAEKSYLNRLYSGVREIDDALGLNSTSGTPFVARSAHASEPAVDAAGAAIAQDNLLITVCEAVSTAAVLPQGTKIFAEQRPTEVVLARVCALASEKGCADRLTSDLTGKGVAAGVVAGLFSRSVLSKADSIAAPDLATALTSSDARIVRPMAKVAVEGDTQTAAELAAKLTRPINQQTSRPLVTAHSSWLDLITSPGDKWIVASVTLTADVQAIISR